MSGNDLEYFVARERIARDHAARAEDPSARHAHLAMAERYAQRVQAMRETPAIPLR